MGKPKAEILDGHLNLDSEGVAQKRAQKLPACATSDYENIVPLAKTWSR